jgi:flagellin
LTKGGVSQTVTIADGAHTVNFDKLGISFKTTDAGVGATMAGAITAATPLTVSAGATAAFQIGYGNTSSQDQLGVTLGNMTAANLKTSGAGLAANDISTSAKAFSAITNIDDAISTLSANRASVGAYQNRLGYASSNLSATLENFTAAESSIRDVDMATEMTNFTKNQILVQAGTAMLAQANTAPQQILTLLKG